jgi:hypothetical protein
MGFRRSLPNSHHVPLPDPIEAIEYLVESRGLSRRDLEPYIGSRGRVAEILNRKQPLTIGMIRRLHTGLGIPAEVLIQRVFSKRRGAPSRAPCGTGARHCPYPELLRRYDPTL